MNIISINTKNLQTLYKDNRIKNCSMENRTKHLGFEYIYTKKYTHCSSDSKNPKFRINSDAQEAAGLYRDGVPLDMASALPGHADTETPRLHYASPSVDQLRDSIRKSSIKGKDEGPSWTGRENELKAMFGL